MVDDIDFLFIQNIPCYNMYNSIHTLYYSKYKLIKFKIDDFLLTDRLKLLLLYD